MNEYQVIARKYRPQTFLEVVGQEAIIQTLLNAIKMKRVAHAYLFSGPRGTGKTTLARLFAKALNCASPLENFEPCNQCPSCKEIALSHALDVMEIDGASHRGIEEIRQINETTLYAPVNGKYKIYLIDEVHMLTKEAFNALLKSLEEPPAQVKFFFATTEPHKIPLTILSRLQRFNLSRIPRQKIEKKLASIAKELGVDVEEKALTALAELSEGGLRDAESLLDQMISFYGQKITLQGVSELLGLLPSDRLFAFDEAFAKEDYPYALKIADELFSSGQNIDYFLQEMIAHYRVILMLKAKAPLDISVDEKTRLLKVLDTYTQEQCLEILELLDTAEREMKFAFSTKTALEMLLIKIVRVSKKVNLGSLVNRLMELEKRVSANTTTIPVKPVIEEKNEAKNDTYVSASAKATPVKPIEQKPVVKETNTSLQEKSRLDTMMRFAAKELNGSLRQK